MSDILKTDIAIVGAGPVGLATAVGLSLRGFSAAVVDTSPPASMAAARGRTAALLNSTVAFLESLDVWRDCASHAAPLKMLQFIDVTGRRFRAPDCSFSAAEIGEEAFGYNIANADLSRVLRRAAEQKGVPVRNSGPVREFQKWDDKLAEVAFEDGARISASLVIAADGGNSAIRNAVGIRSFSWTYDQIAAATSFAHERPHNGVCLELHRAAGPFTLVPLPGNRSSLVWVERKSEARRLLDLEAEDFCREVEKVSRLALGRVFDVSERGGFPLSSLVAREYGKNRAALVGEAAHVTPPIGAQGLNLGFRDVAVLLDLLEAARGRGEDIGGPSLLRAYSAARRGDVMTRTLGVDLLNRSLLSAFLPFQLGRGAGLYALASIGPLRRAFMRRGISPSGVI